MKEKASSLRNAMTPTPMDVSQWDDEVESVLKILDELRSIPALRYGWQVKLSRPVRVKGLPVGRVLTARAAMDLIERICALPIQEDHKEHDLATLEALIPTQQIAPIVFEVVARRIYVVDPDRLIDDQENRNISQSLNGVLEYGERVVTDVGLGNHLRIREVVAAIDAALKNEDPPIQIGQKNRVLEECLGSARDELGVETFGLAVAYMRLVDMHLSQYPEWRQFWGRSAEADPSYNILRNAATAAESIAKATGNMGNACEPKVPVAFETLLSYLDFAHAVRSKAEYAIAKSVENFVSAVLSYKIEELSKRGHTSARALPLSKSFANDPLAAVAVEAATVMMRGLGDLSPHWMARATHIISRAR